MDRVPNCSIVHKNPPTAPADEGGHGQDRAAARTAAAGSCWRPLRGRSTGPCVVKCGIMMKDDIEGRDVLLILTGMLHGHLTELCVGS